jgi:molybdopterin-guanine dinucleotide biosynthesis protein B
MNVPIISIVGQKNSGKTTLVEKIIGELKQRGYRVGAIKHDAHRFEIDHKGKDTWRMTKAGAETVVISSNEKMAMVKKIDKEDNVNEIAHWLLGDMDIIITEGYKRQNKPKIEITSTGKLICRNENNLIAIAYIPQNGKKPDGLEYITGMPYFNADDTKGVVNFIIEKIKN